MKDASAQWAVLIIAQEATPVVEDGNVLLGGVFHTIKDER